MHAATRRRQVLSALAATLALGVPLTLATPASADPRVHNGSISFGRFDPGDGAFHLWVADRHGRHEHKLTTDATDFSDWRSDGRRIAFDFVDGAGDVHIAVIRPDGSHRHSLTTALGIQEVPTWSPDGAHLAFDAFDPSEPQFRTHLWLMDSDGSHQHQITSDAFDVEPVYAPNGSRIAFARITDDENGVAGIYTVRPDGTRLREVVPPTRGLEHPDWSPDGRWITYDLAPELDGPDAGSIFAVHPDGSELHVLRAATAHRMYFKPRWSPDGRRFLSGCYDDRVGRDQLCTFRSGDHGHVHVLPLSGDDPVNFPAWGARPSHHD